MRRVIATIAVVIVLVALKWFFGLCRFLVWSGAGIAFVYSGAYYVGADQPHWSMTSWLFNEARNRSIWARASGMAVPTGLDDPARIIAGVAHFSEHCVVCHGAPGVERGDIAEGLYPRPPNLADAARFYTPAELFWIVKHGIRMTGMPAWGDHSDDELWATIAFVEKLPGMTEQDYTKLVAASRAQGAHQHDGHQDTPQPGTAQPLGASDHDHPAGHRH